MSSPLSTPELQDSRSTTQSRNSVQTFASREDATRKFSVPLGDEIPRNVQDLLYTYFETNNTATVPRAIYCLQSPRIFSCLSGKAVVYRCHQTGEQLQVRGYVLPSMRAAGKTSERLLVAKGRAYPEPIVLYRTKPHSQNFRIWKGADDDGQGLPVIQRQVTDHIRKVESKKRPVSSRMTQSAEARNVARIEDTANNDTEETPSRQLSKTPREHQTPKSSRRFEESGGVANALHELHPSNTSEHPIDRPARSTGWITSNATPAPTISDLTKTKPDVDHAAENASPESSPPPKHHTSTAERIFFHFISSLTGTEVRNPRPLAKCDNVDTLFAHAVAGDVLSGTRRVAVLEATIGESGKRINVVDEDDFQDLVRAVAQDGCWEEQGRRCEVYVRAVGEQRG